MPNEQTHWSLKHQKITKWHTNWDPGSYTVNNSVLYKFFSCFFSLFFFFLPDELWQEYERTTNGMKEEEEMWISDACATLPYIYAIGRDCRKKKRKRKKVGTVGGGGRGVAATAVEAFQLCRFICISLGNCNSVALFFFFGTSRYTSGRPWHIRFNQCRPEGRKKEKKGDTEEHTDTITKTKRRKKKKGPNHSSSN